MTSKLTVTCEISEVPLEGNSVNSVATNCKVKVQRKSQNGKCCSIKAQEMCP